MELTKVGVKPVHFIRTLINEFVRDRCPIRAAGLSFISLLALVPLSAVVFSVFTAFGAFESFYQRMQEFIILRIFPAAGEEIAEGLQTFVENARSLGVAGLIFFIVTSVLLFNAVSTVFNSVWGCTYRRPFTARFTSYISVLVLGSVLLGAGISLTAAVRIYEAPQVVLEILSRIFTFAVFLVLILLVPSGKVRFTASLVGTITGTALWEVSRVLFIYWTNSVMRVSVIYGSLAAVPILLLWLYVAWTISLFSLETAFVFQHRKKPVVHPPGEVRVPYESVALGTEVFLFIAGRYRRGKGATTVSECSLELSTGEVEIEELTARLLDAGILISITDTGESFLPGRPLSSIRMNEVITALFGGGRRIFGDDTYRSGPVARSIDAFLEAGAGDTRTEATAEEILASDHREGGT